MKRFIVKWSPEKQKWVILNTYSWDTDGNWRVIDGTATNNKEEIEKEAKRMNRGLGLEKYGLSKRK